MKNALVQPYLSFGGRCEEALEFYRTALGAQVDFITRYKDSPEPLLPGMVPAAFENKIMHATFRVGESVLLPSDRCKAGPSFDGFSLALVVAAEAEADHAFGALSAGGQVIMPLTKTFWSPHFGTLTDRFGLGWMVSDPFDRAFVADVALNACGPSIEGETYNRPHRIRRRTVL